MKRLAIALVLLGGCGDGGAADEAAAEETRLRDYGVAQVRKLLREPDKATFTAVRVSRKSGHPAICGYVTTPNAAIQKFVSGGATVIEEQMETGAMDEVWATLC